MSDVPHSEDADEAQVQALTEAAAQGDSKAIEALLERYLPDVRAFVRLRAGPLIRARESSSDIVQSVCRDVLEHQERFRHPNEAAFKHWLFTTALRKILKRRDYYRAQKRDALREAAPPAQGVDASEAGADRRLLDAYATFSTPSGKVMVREEVERIERAFEDLSEDYREVITLAHLVGLSRAEIAERMGKTEGAVRVLLHRALARVSTLLSD